MISMTSGNVNAFALNNLQERGVMFVEPGEPVYEGQIVAENARDNDMTVNPTTAKKLTNMRTTSSDENIILKPARKMTLEQALEYIEEDELVEATPQSIRLRKELLTENERKKAGRKQGGGGGGGGLTNGHRAPRSAPIAAHKSVPMTDERILLLDGDVAIIQRGRGPEIQGTRITVYDVVDYQRMGWSAERTAGWLRLTVPQDERCAPYIDAHQDEVAGAITRRCWTGPRGAIRRRCGPRSTPLISGSYRS